jgi:hypothetical protein
MKKLTLSVAALTIAMMSYGQLTIKEDIDRVNKRIEAYNDSVTFEMNSSISFNRFEVAEMINTIEDILYWQREDETNGDFSHGSYEEMWGSAYWLTLMKDELYAKLVIVAKQNELNEQK